MAIIQMQILLKEILKKEKKKQKQNEYNKSLFNFILISDKLFSFKDRVKAFKQARIRGYLFNEYIKWD